MCIWNQSIGEDWNRFDWVWQPFGVYHCIMIVLLLYTIALTMFVTKQSITVTNIFREGRRIRAETMSFAMRMLILGPELLGGIIGVFGLVDPLGILLVVDFFTARTMANFRAVVVGTTDIVMVVYCYDIIRAMKSSGSLR